MKRSIFILLITLQCLTCMEVEPTLDEIEKYVDLSMDDSENDMSIEELGLTTLTYETRTEPNPPISTPSTTTSPPDMSMESNERVFVMENTESPVVVSESSEVVEEHLEGSGKKMKGKGRLLDNSSEFYTKSDRLDETPSLEETTVADIDSDNETNVDTLDAPTTVLPLTSKKPKNLLYKTRPNILLRYYVEEVTCGRRLLR
jgi:hypothetical protein